MEQSFFDRIDEHDNLVGGTASYDEVHSQGLWHRGVHVIIYTPEREIVAQKRAPTLNYHPNEIEVSVGGGVDAGESAEQAAVREVHEELGLKISVKDLRFISKTKTNHRTRTQNIRCFKYGYSICIPKDRLTMHINAAESSAAFLISEKKLRRALKVHRIKHFGKISSQYAYWKYLLDAI